MQKRRQPRMKVVSTTGSKRSSLLRRAREALEMGNLEEAKRLLEPFVKRRNAEAIFLRGNFSGPNEPLARFERRMRRSIEIAANKGYPPAVYRLGAHLDMGERFETFSYPRDKGRAALLFKRAADLGHRHSQWIYAMDLLYGSPHIEKNVPLGLEYLRRALEGGFVGAYETMAQFHETGKFGLEVNTALADEYRRQARSSDVVQYS